MGICTHNRARLLDQTLQSICAAAPPVEHQLEILVTASACTDSTLQVLNAHRGRLPITVIEESRAGASLARNVAARRAHGRIIVWIDDDVRVQPDWLLAYERAFRAFPDAKLFGGSIIPAFEGGPPAWLSEAFHLCESAYATRSHALSGPIELASNSFPYGANFAIDADLQRRFPFDQQLGRRPGRWIVGGEEIESIRALRREGHAGRWVPESVVEHVMTPERQTVAYLRRYFEGHGYVLGLLETQRGEARPALLSELRAMARTELRFRRDRLTGPATTWVPSLIAAAIARGSYSGRRVSAADRSEGHP